MPLPRLLASLALGATLVVPARAADRTGSLQVEYEQNIWPARVAQLDIAGKV